MSFLAGDEIRLSGVFAPAPGEDPSTISAINVKVNDVAVTGVVFAASPDPLWDEGWVAKAGHVATPGAVLWTALWTEAEPGNKKLVAVALVGGVPKKSAPGSFTVVAV